MGEPTGCKRCGHLIGYHWDGDGEMWCSALNCDCKGYVDPDEPKIVSRLPKAANDQRETSP